MISAHRKATTFAFGVFCAEPIGYSGVLEATKYSSWQFIYTSKLPVSK